jgi:hypothetical protein
MSSEERCGTPGTQAREGKLTLLASPKFGQDALGPLLAGALFVDIPRALFGPFAYVFRKVTGMQPRGGDRAEAIERAFEQLWLQAQPSVPGSRSVTFGNSFLSLFYDGNTIREGMPIWIANGTDVRTGTRLLTVPFDAREPWPFLGASDVLSALGSDVPISTAINNTARFPYLEPSGELLRYRVPGEPEPQNAASGSEQIIDGGYFENEGLQTALDLADWIETRRGANPRIGQPIIVQATGSGEATFVPASIIRCSNPKDDPSVVTPGPLPLEIIAPLIGLYSVRSGHSDIVLRQTRDTYCPGQPQSFFHFFLPGLKSTPDAKTRTEVPLNWVLSTATHDFIWGALDDSESGNAAERSLMAKAFSAP